MDSAHQKTDKMLEEMEKRLNKVYSDAQKEIDAKINNYFSSFSKKDSEMRKKVDAGEMTESAYKAWRQNQMMTGKHWENMRDSVAKEMTNANKTAAAYINNKLPEVYSINYNAIDDGMIKGISFELADPYTVKNLATKDDTLLPYKEVDGKKDVRWNTKQVNSQVMQGILQGDSVQKLAKRLEKNIPEMNYASAVRNARTTFTSAENKGRMDSYHAAEDMGIVMKKVWMSTHDERTRPEHAELDGVEVDVDEPFHNSLGDIMYPGDPDADDPGNVYNCRCTMVTHIVGFKNKDGKVTEYDGHKYEPDYFDNTEQETEERAVVNGKDMLLTWDRRENEYNFEIDDIINAQGFDGLPKIVSEDEFNEAVKKNGIICQRGYTAPNEETLHYYQDELYNGTWYVDCSKGGAAFGQGMYSVGNYGTELSEQSLREVSGYGKNGIIETFTLDDAKIINHDMLNGERWKAQYEIYRDAMDVKLTETQDTLLKLMCNYPMSNEEGMKAWKLLEYKDDVKLVTELKAAVAGEKNVMDAIQRTLTMKDGSFAAIRGYDAIQVDINNKGDKYFVVLNRTKCIFKRNEK